MIFWTLYILSGFISDSLSRWLANFFRCPKKHKSKKQKTKNGIQTLRSSNSKSSDYRPTLLLYQNQLDRINGIRVSLLFVELISYPVMALFPQSRRVLKTLTVSRRLAARAGWFNSTERETFSNNKEWSSWFCYNISNYCNLWKKNKYVRKRSIALLHVDVNDVVLLDFVDEFQRGERY